MGKHDERGRAGAGAPGDLESWRRACAQNADHPRAKELFDRDVLPAFHDPFAGGGTLPLEAQRLGLEAYASDLNPVAVLITKAMIEIPPRFAGKPPVNPEARQGKGSTGAVWKGAAGLAEDVRYYGQWMRDEAEKRIGHLYPKVRVTAEMVRERPDLEPYAGRDLTVIAWLWARTVKSPNPAFADVEVPLVSTFILSKKKGREAYVEPVFEEDGYRFTVKTGEPPESAQRGTKSGGSHSSFVCLMSGTPMPFDYLRSEGKAGRLGVQLMAIVVEGDRRRLYLAPLPEQHAAGQAVDPKWQPGVEISHWPGRTNVVEYGLTSFGDLFTDRQLVALTTFSDLVAEARDRVHADAVAAGVADDGVPLRDGGTGATAYAETVGVYLALAVSKLANIGSSIATWMSDRGAFRETFARQAIPMTWDYAEANPFADAGGSLNTILSKSRMALEAFLTPASGTASQVDASTQVLTAARIVSTDPPYYDNIGYADLSDFFYVWLRRSLQPILPDLFATLAVPKAEELVATPYRHGSKEKAEAFFLDGMKQAMQRLAEQAHPAFPVTIYYAFKQSESKGDTGTVSTGWETFLGALIQAGFAVSGTWPMRTEGTGRILAKDANALASSIVLTCRPRAADAPAATRREFQGGLRSEFPKALADLRRSNIAPVDLAQAAIGPGMAIFTRYSEVLKADGSTMTVREALALINATLDELLAEQEGDFDADTRWALAWFEEAGFAEGAYGLAETLATAKDTSVGGMVEAGVLRSGGGKVRLLRPGELPADWDPAKDARLTVWEMAHHLIRVHEQEGEAAAAALAAKLGSKAEDARDLAYRLYVVSERKRRAQDALSYNALVQSWPEIARLGRERRVAKQGQFAIEGVQGATA